MPPPASPRNLPNEFTTEFQTKILAIALREPYFLRLYADVFQVTLFDTVYHRDACLWISEYYSTYKQPPATLATLRRLLDERIQRTNALYMNYAALLEQLFFVDISEARYITDQLITLVRYQSYKAALIQATDLLETGDFDGIDTAFNSARNVGQGAGDIGLELKSAMEQTILQYGNLNNGLNTRFSRLQAAVGGYLPGEETVVVAPAGQGKASCESSIVYTANGPKLMRDIVVGDQVIGSDGRGHRVLKVYPQGIKEIFKVTFSDSTFTRVTEDHLWSVSCVDGTKNNILTTGELRWRSLQGRNTGGAPGIRNRYYIPVVKPVKFESNASLPLDAYALGLLIGNGGLTGQGVKFSSHNQSLYHKLRRALPRGDELVTMSKAMPGKEYRINGKLQKTRAALQALGLFGLYSTEKFIPTEYLYGRLADRKALLSGLLDTDGCCDAKHGTVSYSTSSEQLKNDFVILVQSLGGLVRVRHKKAPTYVYKGQRRTGHEAWEIFICYYPDWSELFQQAKDRKNQLRKFAARKRCLPRRFIKSIEPDGHEKAKCILLDSNDHLYATDNFILTHNTAFMGNLALGASIYDSTVIYYTLEIRAARMLCRFYANLAGVRTRDLTENIDRVRRAIHRYELSTNGTVYVKFMPARAVTVDTIRAHLSMVQNQGITPAMIIVDYADLLKPKNSRYEVKTYEQLRETYEELRMVGDEFGVHVVTGSQSTKQTLYASIIDLDDLAESWGKAQTADSVIAICQTFEEQSAGVGRLYVAKARNETRGSVVHFVANYDVLRMREVDADNYARQLRARGFSVNERGLVPTAGGRRARAANASLGHHYDH